MVDLEESKECSNPRCLDGYVDVAHSTQDGYESWVTQEPCRVCNDDEQEDPVIDKLKLWLNQEVKHSSGWGAPTEMIPRYKRIGFLLSCNGGSFVVCQWGTIGYGGGPFRNGLEQEEAMELMHYSSFFDGCEFMGAPVHMILEPFLKSYYDEIMALYKAHQQELGQPT